MRPALKIAARLLAASVVCCLALLPATANAALGRFIGGATTYGPYAIAHFDAHARHPRAFRLRVATDPAAQVDIHYSVACRDGYKVDSDSDETTIFGSGVLRLEYLFIRPDECIFGVAGQLVSGPTTPAPKLALDLYFLKVKGKRH